MQWFLLRKRLSYQVKLSICLVEDFENVYHAVDSKLTICQFCKCKWFTSLTVTGTILWQRFNFW